MNILEQLRQELEGVDTERLAIDLSPVQEGERVLGEIRPEDRPLFALSYKLGQEADKVGEEMTTKSFRGRLEDSPVARRHELLQKSEALDKLFWLSVMAQYRLWAKPINVTIRKDWKLVICD